MRPSTWCPTLLSGVVGQLSRDSSAYAWPPSARRPSDPPGARPWGPWQPLPSPTSSSVHAAALHTYMILKQGSEPSDLALPMLAAGLTRDFPRSSDLIHTHTERYDAVLSCTAPITQHGSLPRPSCLSPPFIDQTAFSSAADGDPSAPRSARPQGERRARSPHHPSSPQRAREPARARGGLHRPCLALTLRDAP
jgi:hypothetical protein